MTPERNAATPSYFAWLVAFECGHSAYLPFDEFGDGSGWCQQCGAFHVYERCPDCGGLNECEHRQGVIDRVR